MIINSCNSDNNIIYDMGLQFGYGCFTTARIYNNKIISELTHINRLKNTCKKLHIVDVNWSDIINEMKKTTALIKNGIIKIIITCGSSNSGYSFSKLDGPNIIIITRKYPYSYYNNLQKNGICLKTSNIKLSLSPHVAGLKHLNRLEQVLIRKNLNANCDQEALVLDMNGMVVECCSANIFWRIGNHLFTPKLKFNGIRGIMRNQIIKFAKQNMFSISDVYTSPDALKKAEEVFICNSLIPVVHVKKIDSKKYGNRSFSDFFLKYYKNYFLNENTNNSYI